ncbi:GNAT family N-acetyltransferase [Candidatus Leptofilum sp.]|uniref:GNAT family N-acetyltransferase n=1 Tax=Candidatus Leptofilum sp. TaxID=3241576 RepID=UPI003B5CA547
MSLIIRPETIEDTPAVYDVEAAAFGRPAEAELAKKLQQANVDTISLVALLDDELVGHILFSPVTVKDGEDAFTAVALGPVAVSPNHQNKGIGAELCRSGLAACQEAGYELAFVLGHSDYYPRFGFMSSAPHGLHCQFDVPDEAFMVLELTPGALQNKHGIVYYHPLFGGV